MQMLQDDGLLIQHREIEARTLLQTIPKTGELYVGDELGTPTALDGVMEHIHDVRWQRYLEHRDNKRDGEAKWF